MKNVRGILIDPVAQSVSEVEIKDYDYTKVYPLIDAGTFGVVVIDEYNVAYIDDDGLFKENQSFFVLGSYPQPLAGKSLVLGNDDDGETVSTSLTVEAAKALVTFRPDIEYKGSIPIPEGTKAQTPFGEAFVVGATPVFGKREESEQ